MRVLLLATDLYSRGGVARYSAALAAAFAECLGEQNVDALALLDWGLAADSGVLRAEVMGSRVNLASKLRYVWRAWRRVRSGYDLVVATHVCAAPVAALLRAWFGTPFWVVCHGSEVWGRLSRLKRAALERADRLLPVSQFTAEKLFREHGLSPLRTWVVYNSIPERFAQMLWEETPHPPSYVGHPLPREREPQLPGPPSCLGLPLPSEREPQKAPVPSTRGEGGPRPATSPAGAGRVRGQFGSDADPFILSVGGMSRASAYKGVDRVIRALPKILAVVPDAHYVVVGEGDRREELASLAAREAVSQHVQFVGEVSDTELACLYRSCCVFVMPSRAFEQNGNWCGEGFGRVYVEAALAAKPVVAGRAAGAAEAVLEGETGWLVDPESTDEIAAAVARLLTSPTLAAKMGRRAREWARENFTQAAMCRVLEKMLAPMKEGARCEVAEAGSWKLEIGNWKSEI